MYTLACGDHSFVYNIDLSGKIKIYDLFPEQENQLYFSLTWEEICFIMDLYKCNDNYDILIEDTEAFSVRFRWKINDNLIIHTEDRFIFREDILHLYRLDKCLEEERRYCPIRMQEIVDFVIYHVRNDIHQKVDDMSSEEILSKIVVRGDKIYFPIS